MRGHKVVKTRAARTRRQSTPTVDRVVVYTLFPGRRQRETREVLKTPSVRRSVGSSDTKRDDERREREGGKNCVEGGT